MLFSFFSPKGRDLGVSTTLIKGGILCSAFLISSAILYVTGHLLCLKMGAADMSSELLMNGGFYCAWEREIHKMHSSLKIKTVCQQVPVPKFQNSGSHLCLEIHSSIM